MVAVSGKYKNKLAGKTKRRKAEKINSIITLEIENQEARLKNTSRLPG
jgi:hypothetical protein